MKQETDDDLRALTNLLDASFANTAKKILIKHGYVEYLGFYEIIAYISRITVNNGKHSWQRIFLNASQLEYLAKLQELLSSGAFMEAPKVTQSTLGYAAPGSYPIGARAVLENIIYERGNPEY